jgi:hypothetical protein
MHSPEAKSSADDGAVSAAMCDLSQLGGQAAWPSYGIARIWLALCHRPPWQVMVFLAELTGEAFRQAGAVYQFRHIELQHRLSLSLRVPIILSPHATCEYSRTRLVGQSRWTATADTGQVGWGRFGTGRQSPGAEVWHRSFT